MQKKSYTVKREMIKSTWHKKSDDKAYVCTLVKAH